jgi:hypothetical protein
MSARSSRERGPRLRRCVRPSTMVAAGIGSSVEEARGPLKPAWRRLLRPSRSTTTSTPASSANRWHGIRSTRTWLPSSACATGARCSSARPRVPSTPACAAGCSRCPGIASPRSTSCPTARRRARRAPPSTTRFARTQSSFTSRGSSARTPSTTRTSPNGSFTRAPWTGAPSAPSTPSSSASRLDSTLGGVVQPLPTASAGQTDSFTLQGHDPKDKTKKRVFSAIRIDWTLDSYSVRVDAQIPVPGVLPTELGDQW